MVGFDGDLFENVLVVGGAGEDEEAVAVGVVFEDLEFGGEAEELGLLQGGGGQAVAHCGSWD